MRRLLGVLFALALCSQAIAQQNFGGGPATGTGYPSNARPVTNSATGTTTATVATLPAATGFLTFICGFVMTSGGTTAAVVGNATVANTISGTLNFAYVSPSSGQGLLGLSMPGGCIPANATNTTIVVTEPAGGAGTTSAVTAWGYQLPQ